MRSMKEGETMGGGTESREGESNGCGKVDGSGDE